MGLLSLFKLEKLQIKAYSKRERSMMGFVGTFKAMFNPESFSQKYEISYGGDQTVNSTGKEVNYSWSNPTDLNLKLIVDGTGVDQIGLARLFGSKTVTERVEKFLDLTYRMNGKIHEPNFLVVEWGELNYSCRLGSVNITYTSFDRDGTPLRAELDASFLSDIAVEKRLAEENKSSPDLTHRRIVKNGDTLPLLTKDIYGSSAYYLRVAQANNLDDFRHLTPGQEIIFPPFEKASTTQ